MTDEHLPLFIVGVVLVLLLARAGIAVMHRRQSRSDRGDQDTP